MSQEIFKDIEGFEGYQISNQGRVVSNRRKDPKFLKPQKDAIGYLHIRLYPEDERFGKYKPTLNYKKRGKKPKLEKVHRLVAEYFVDKPDTTEYLEVNHKDLNKQNNVSSNLEWVTRAYNIQHSYDNGARQAVVQKMVEATRKSVKVTYKDGTVEYFLSVMHCAFSIGMSPAAVTARFRNQANGKKQSFGKKGVIIEHCKELPPGETFKQILEVEEKMLKWRNKYYPKDEEHRKYRREYARKWRQSKKKK
jgi:hypothetical protein